MIKFKTGDIFDADLGTYLVHACNCQGMWGSGIAAQFAIEFPKSYAEYREYCRIGDAAPGDILICDEERGRTVVCLFTSRDYGKLVDSPEKILEATKHALMYLPTDKPIHMPLINSGKFLVPWSDTAALIGAYDDLDITIWSLK